MKPKTFKASEAGVFDNHHQILRKKDAWESRVGLLLRLSPVPVNHRDDGEKALSLILNGLASGFLYLLHST